MLTRKKFTILLLTAILSAAFTSFIVIGVFSHDFTFAIVSFLLLVSVFIVGIYTADSTPKRRAGDVKLPDSEFVFFEDHDHPFSHPKAGYGYKDEDNYK